MSESFRVGESGEAGLKADKCAEVQENNASFIVASTVLLKPLLLVMFINLNFFFQPEIVYYVRVIALLVRIQWTLQDHRNCVMFYCVQSVSLSQADLTK